MPLLCITKHYLWRVITRSMHWDFRQRAGIDVIVHNYADCCTDNDRFVNGKFNCLGLARPGDPHRWYVDVRHLRAVLPAWQPRELAAALSATLRQWNTRPA